jgi:hypothetical protein
MVGGGARDLTDDVYAMMSLLCMRSKVDAAYSKVDAASLFDAGG